MPHPTRRKPARKAAAPNRRRSEAKAKPKRPQLTRDDIDAIFKMFSLDGDGPDFSTLFGNGNAESGHDQILEIPVDEIHPSPENDQLYRPVDPADPEIIKLADSINQNGLLEPIIITLDGYIVSGHRRYAAALLAGLLTVPCRVLSIRRTDDIDAFVRLLREHNRQRDKTRAEKLREELVEIIPQEAHEALFAYRREQAAVDVVPLTLSGRRSRAEISSAKLPFLKAAQAIIYDLKGFWPLSDRRIHYALLNDPPLRHASKPGSRYRNTLQSYKSLVDLLTRARLDGSIPMEAIGDETRPVQIWNVYADSRSFIRAEVEGLLKGFWRNLQQSQPNHIEIIGEKNTVAPVLKPVAADYCVPLTTGRGYCSLPPRHAMAQRFEKSGKDKLVLLFVTDFDADGEEIAHSFARSMRDDFGIDAIHPIKVALTGEQVREYKLPPIMRAKESSVHHDKFVAKHGHDVFELEALAPEVLQTILRKAIESVIDREAYADEIAAEREDAAHLAAIRQMVLGALKEMDLNIGTDE